MATFRIPTPLRQYADGNTLISVDGASVEQALNDLTTQYPDLRNHLYDGDKLRSFVNIYLGQEDIRHLQGVETTIEETTTLLIVPSIAGGNLEQIV